MIFTEKSAYQSQNRDLWKITKNVTTHHQIVRFGSFLDMLVLVTSRIDFSFKILIFSFFSEKSPNFSKNSWFWPILAENQWFFAEKWKYQNFDTKIYSIGYMDQQWVKSDYLVMSCFSWIFTNRNFQHGMLIFQWKSSIFHWIFTFLHFCPSLSKVHTKFMFWSTF